MAKKIIEAFAQEVITKEDFDSLLSKVFKVEHKKISGISKDFIKNLMPLLEKIPDYKFDNPIFREEISKKIFGDEEGGANNTPARAPYEKKIEIKDVEENAEILKKARTVVPPEVNQRPEKGESDPYKESIE